MKVFVIWSGEPSHDVARALRDWLPLVLPFVEPWISSEDIEKGARWSVEIASQLDSTDFGVICVVPDNLTEPWLNFEAGAISKSVESARVAPLLVKVDRSEITGPLAQFQLTVFEKEDLRRLIQTINKKAASPLPSDHLNRTFDLCWPGLDAKISAVEFSCSPAPGAVQSSRRPAEPPGEQIQILKLIAERGDYEFDADGIARAIQQNKTRTQHYLDQLVRDDLLDEALSYTDSTRYGLTKAGRAFLVKKGLV